MSSNERAAGVDVLRLIPRTDDPPADPDAVLVYNRMVDEVRGPVLRTLVRFSNGTVVVIL